MTRRYMARRTRNVPEWAVITAQAAFLLVLMASVTVLVLFAGTWVQ